MYMNAMHVLKKAYEVMNDIQLSSINGNNS